MYSIFILVISLIAILFIAIIFCNALEHLGEKLGISEGMTGSIFAAVGTALPETVIPLLALFSATEYNVNTQIGIGAILGAPLMLSTLSLFIMAVFISRKRGLGGRLHPELRGLKKDLAFFLLSYSLAFGAALIPEFNLRKVCLIAIAISLFILYFIYLLVTIKSSAKLVREGHVTVAKETLFLNRLGFKVNFITITLQLILALLLLIYCSENFIDSVNEVALKYSVSPFLLSLLIIPIATELPEKINSILWLYKGKDTLAISNITGALVFQGSLLPMLGILATEWRLGDGKAVVVSIMITLIAALWLYLHTARQNLRIWHFLVCGIFYFINIALIIQY